MYEQFTYYNSYTALSSSGKPLTCGFMAMYSLILSSHSRAYFKGKGVSPCCLHSQAAADADLLFRHNSSNNDSPARLDLFHGGAVEAIGNVSIFDFRNDLIAHRSEPPVSPYAPFKTLVALLPNCLWLRPHSFCLPGVDKDPPMRS